MLTDHKELRHFGFILATLFLGGFGFAFPLFSHKPIPLWPYCLSAPLLILTLLKPNALKWVYHIWMKCGHVLGWINTRVILGIIYFLLITPMGIILRLMKKDRMQKQYDYTISSYRKITHPSSSEHMEKPF